MNAPASALAPSQVWRRRQGRLVILGRTSLNAPLMTEAFPFDAHVTRDDVTLADLIEAALTQAGASSSIPADLAEGVEFRFV